jgi:antirestriction protein ArdC
MVRLERPKAITACVFNAEQIDGIPALEPEQMDLSSHLFFVVGV